MINQRGGRVPPVHLLVRLRGSPLTIQDESAVPRAAGRGSAARLRDPRRAEPRVLRPCFASLVRPVQMPETLGIRAGSVPSQLLRVDPRDFLHPQFLDAGARVARRPPTVRDGARIRPRPRGATHVRLARTTVDYRFQLAARARAFLIQLVRAREAQSLGRLARTPHERRSYQRLVLEGAPRYRGIPPRRVTVPSILPFPAPLLPEDRVLADQPVRETLAFAFHRDQAPLHYLETAQLIKQHFRLPAAVYLQSCSKREKYI